MGEVEAISWALGSIIVSAGLLLGVVFYLIGLSRKDAERDEAEARNRKEQRKAESERQLDGHTKML